MEDYYNVLGISKNSTSSDIKKKFRQLQFQYENNNNESTIELKKKYEKICQAYHILGDIKEREKYDKEIEKDLIIHETFIDNSVNNKATDMFTIIGEQLLNNVMKNMTNLENQNVTPPFPFNLPNIANYPSNIQSNLANAQTIKDVNTQEATIIKPLIQILEITYLQAYKGCILPIEIERKIYVNELTNTFTTEKETIYIDIPKGVDTNEILFFSNKGDIIGNNYGELKVNIKLLEDELYKREGLDLIYVKKITLKEALCGCVFYINHLNEKSFKISTYGNILNPNSEQRMPLLGFQRMDCSPIGDLIIRFEILFPDILSKDSIDNISNSLP